jgi:hypothetical protein
VGSGLGGITGGRFTGGGGGGGCGGIVSSVSFFAMIGLVLISVPMIRIAARIRPLITIEVTVAPALR